MSDQLVRVIVAVVLLVHGAGHVLGVLPAFGITLGRTQAAGSWLFTDGTGVAGGREMGFVLWAVTLVGFVAAGLALLGWLLPQSWWQGLAIASAVLSTLVVAAFWWGLPFLFPHKLGAMAVNAAVFVCLLWLRWPPQLLAD
jgi:hypothetical protein